MVVIISPYGNAPSPLDSLLDTFSRCLNPESAQRVTEFRVDPEVQARIAADLISILTLKATPQLTLDRR